MTAKSSGSRPPSRWKLFLALGLLFLLLSCGSVTGVGIWLFFRLRPLFAAESRPTLCITTRYAGASAQVVEDTIALPLEVQLSGMEGLDTIESICGDDGTMRLTLYLRPRTDLATVKVLAQNRTALALPMLPDVVKHRGLAITSAGPLPAVWLFVTSPDGQWDQRVLQHVAQSELVPRLTALPGVESATVGWDEGPDLCLALDPEKLKAHDLKEEDVEKAWLAQADAIFEARLLDEQIGQRVIGADKQGRAVQVSDVGKILQAKTTAEWARWRGQVAVAIAVEGADPAALFASVRDHLPELQGRLKEGMSVSLVPGPFVPGSDGLLIEGRLPVTASNQRIFQEVDRIAQEIDHIPDARAKSLAPAALTLPCAGSGTFRLYVALPPAAERSATSADLRAQARRILADIPDVPGRVVRPQSLTLPPLLRAPVVLSITGPALEETTRLADAIHERLCASDAVTEVWPAYPRYRSSTFVVVDREKAKKLRVPMKEVLGTLLIFSGEVRPNGFHAADGPIALLGPDLAKMVPNLKVPNDEGRMVPLSDLTTLRELTGPEFIQRINGQRRLLITARPASGVSIEEARRRCREIAEQVLRERNLPNGYQIECTGPDTVERE
ncbi:MAG TPA: efflux RND transporter permease subunit [Gemmataceae bacterium]|jgi:multidrug efflux pump subunit AcrB